MVIKIEQTINYSQKQISHLLSKGYETASLHNLDSEKQQYVKLIKEIMPHE